MVKNFLSLRKEIKKMPKNLLTPQQALENGLLLSIFLPNLQEQIVLENGLLLSIFLPNLQEQIVLGYSSQIFLSSTTSIFSLSKFVASYGKRFALEYNISQFARANRFGVLNPNFEIRGLE